MATVKTLIEQLQEIENQDQTIIFQYYTADMLTKADADGNVENLTDDQMTELSDRIDDNDHFWDDVWEGIAEFIEELSDEKKVQWQVQSKDFEDASTFSWVAVDTQFDDYDEAVTWARENLGSDYRVVELESAV